jgi:peptidoglycan/LPS O-acetylase OafA/YrhL
VSSLLYVQNWNSLVAGDSYFAMFDEPSPLIHAWSLAIEEQWYVVWPVLFLVLHRIVAKRFTPAVIAGLAACSALAMAFTANGSDLSRAYFGTDTRVQALLIGAGTALVLTAPQRRLGLQRERRVSICAAGGLIGWVLLVVFAADNDLWMYRGGFTAAAICVARRLLPLERCHTASTSGTGRCFSCSPQTELTSANRGCQVSGISSRA